MAGCAFDQASCRHVGAQCGSARDRARSCSSGEVAESDSLCENPDWRRSRSNRHDGQGQRQGREQRYLPLIALSGVSEADRKSQPPTFGRQRDVLPLCFTSLSAEDLPKEYSETDLLPGLRSARFAWMGLMITCITWHYGFGENGATVRPLFGPPMPTQFSSLVRRGTAADVMCRLNPKSIGARDWVWDLNCSAISYSGEEVRIAEPASEVPNESKLPPCGVAASIPIVPLVHGETRRGILNPQLIRKDEAEFDCGLGHGSMRSR